MVDSRNREFAERVKRAVASCLLRHAHAKQAVVVGFSGGLDSTVLLHAVHTVATEMGLDLSALHVNHGLSPNADAWGDSCALFCRELDLPLTTIRVKVPFDTGEGIEGAARRLRHKLLTDQPADWVLLAHHADDQAETVLHNLVRGSGVRGAAAMQEAHGRVLRPLLGVAREALLAYARSRQLVWVEDESNADNRYTRNFFRHQILPLVATRFPRVGEQLAAAAARFSEASSLLDDLARLDLRDHAPEFPLPRELFCELSAARARNLLRTMLTWHSAQPPDERRLNEFVRQLQTAANDRHPRLDLAQYVLWCEAGRVCYRRRQD